MKKIVFIKNAAVLTFSSLFLRFLGILLKIWLAARIGAEGIGLYQLIFSFFIFISTFASSGICTAVTRLSAEEISLGSSKSVIKILRKSISITLFISIFTGLLVFFSADIISKNIIFQENAVISIKILAFSLPFMGMSSCLRGYFISRRKATPPALVQIAEQLIRIFLIYFFICILNVKGISQSCAAIFLSDTVAEILSFLLLFITFLSDKKHLISLNGRKTTPYHIKHEIGRIALPITAGRYLTSGLRTAENTLVPQGLERYGSLNSLSQFGMIKGMALPILFFPSTILNSIVTMLIPELSESKINSRKYLLKQITEEILKITSLISYIFAAVFLFFGKQIGLIFFKDESVGYLLFILAPIVPLMYIDSVSDGILKGLDEQNFCFKTGVVDSALRIILIIAILPFFGMNGFLGIMYFSNFLTCFMNTYKLVDITNLKLNISKTVLFPVSAALTAVMISKYLFNVFINNILVYIIFVVLFSVFIYILILFALKIINKNEILNIITKK